MEAVPHDIRETVSDAALRDLQAVADQNDISLQEAIDRYGWHNDFSFAVAEIREVTPETFSGAEIVDGSHAWIAFTDTPAGAVLDIVDAFTSKYSRVSVEVRTGQRVTEAELEEAVTAVHDAVRKTPEALETLTFFDSRTNQIKTTVVLADASPDSVVDDLRAIGEKRLIEVTRPDILDSISVSVTRATVPVLVIKE